MTQRVNKLSKEQNQRVLLFSPFVQKKISILAILVLKRVLFLHSSLKLGLFLEEATFFIIIDKTFNKSPAFIIPITAVVDLRIRS